MEYGRYYSAAADDYVDISGGSSRGSSGGYGYSDNGGGGNRNKIIIIVSAAAAVVIAAAVIIFCVALMNNDGDSPDSAPKEFVFAENTKVSGLDISGKTPAQAKTYLEQNKKSFIKPVKFTVKIGDETEVLTQNDFEYEYNIDQVVSQIEADERAEKSTADAKYEVKATPTDKSVTDKSAALCEEHYSEPKNAYVTEFHPYSDNRFDIEEAKSGISVDKDDLKKQLNNAFNSGKSEQTITAYTEETSAEVTADFLKKNLVKLASYETYSTNTENATSNMRVALASCNGSIIDPEEIWSFNDCTGDSNLKSNGYLPANVIVNGKIEQGIGGGICQASSTIYNAAIRAGLSIYERAPHEWASVYVPTGLDATIDYPNIDLKLENVSDYQVFLECKLVNYTLYATFWGVKNPDYDEIKVRNELGETKGSKYYVNAYRVYYKDGKKTGEKELPSSYYDLKNGKVFYPADNDAGAVDSDVDDITEPVVIPTQPQTSAQSSNDDTQSPVPETTAKATTQAETQTENQNNAEP